MTNTTLQQHLCMWTQAALFQLWFNAVVYDDNDQRPQVEQDKSTA